MCVHISTHISARHISNVNDKQNMRLVEHASNIAYITALSKVFIHLGTDFLILVRICRNVYISISTFTHIHEYDIHISRHKSPCTSAHTSAILLAGESPVNAAPRYQLDRNYTPNPPYLT